MGNGCQIGHHQRIQSQVARELDSELVAQATLDKMEQIGDTGLRKGYLKAAN